MSTIGDVWEDAFAASSPPAWLIAFEEDPYRAVDALLRRRFYHGSLNLAEPEDLVVDWILLIGEAGEFTSRLDRAIGAWVEMNWGSLGDESTTRLADAWSRLADIVAATGTLTGTAQTLRLRFGEAQEYLGSFSVSPSQDPLGRYLNAIAGYQRDRTLAPYWWQLCDLPDRVPFYHAPYAIAGLRGLPPLDEEQSGGFRLDLVHGLMRLAAALARKRELSAQQMKDLFLAIAHRAMAAYPFPEQWESALRLLPPTLPETQAGWFAILVSDISRSDAEPRRRSNQKPKYPTTLKPHPGWAERAGTLARALARRAPKAVAEAQALLKEQQAYAEKTGDSYFLVRSLGYFASVVASSLPHQALKWAKEARLWEPSDPITWTTLTKALRHARGPEAALATAWTSIERFPEEAAAWNTLGEVLRELERFDEAEEVYRQSRERFTNNVYTWTGLGEVLKDAGRLEEAHDVYRLAHARFSENVYTWTGLAEVLKEEGWLEEAQAIYEEARTNFEPNPYVWSGLADTLKLRGNLSKAKEVYEEALKLFPDDHVARTGLASVLRRLGANHLLDALRLVERVLDRNPREISALEERVRILDDLQRFTEAGRARVKVEEAKRLPLEERVRLSPSKAEVLLQPPSAASLTERIPTSMSEKRSGEAPPTSSAIPLSQESVSSSPPLSDNQLWHLVAQTSEARFLRRWARRVEESGGAAKAKRLKERAKDQLQEVLRHRTFDSRAVAEMSLLLLADNSLDEAQRLAEEKLAKFPASPPTALALVRTRRSRTEQMGVRLDGESEALLYDSARRLRAADSQLEPLVRLELGRGYLALSNGSLRAERAARQFQRLGETIAEERAASPNGFWRWWTQEIVSSVFHSVNTPGKLSTIDLETIETNLTRSAHWVDTLEEDLSFRFSRLPL